MKREEEEDAIEEKNRTYERKKRCEPEKGRIGWSTIFIN